MPVPDFDATVRGLYRAAIGDAPWEAALASLRDGLGAEAITVRDGPQQVAAPSGVASHTIELRPWSGNGHEMAVQITWPASLRPDAATAAWLDRLAPHLHDALRAHQKLRQIPARAHLGHLLLDTQPHPAWLLQADGSILWANASARRPGAGAHWLQVAGPALSLREPADQRALDAGRKQALASQAGQRVLVPLMGAPGAPGDQAYADASAPQSVPARWLLRRLPGPAGDPALLAILFDPGETGAGISTLSAPELAGAFAFTPAESRVAVCLAQGCTVREIAGLLGVAPSTIRSHLDAVMVKLGADRKVDAVRMLVQAGWMWRAWSTEVMLDA